MDAEAQLAALKPMRIGRVFDLVQSLGFDVSDWIATASNPRKIRANPKYCYDWSFIVPDERAIFNLWHGAMNVEAGEIVYRDNFRQNAEFHRLNGGRSKWIERGEKLDRHAAIAARDKLQVRVIVVDGQRRNTEDPASESSSVDGREIDPLEWHVRNYDLTNGDFVLVRGPRRSQFIDQFDVAELEESEPTKHEIAGSAYNRDRAVRHAALARANGKCEYCGESGFKMANGGIYLETHHVIPLCEGGKDSIRNVAALCPNDHKKAHFAAERVRIRQALLGQIG
jgi:5-methylcytosine-specific restriction protein A